MSPQLGFSTGTLHKTKLRLREQIAVIRSVGCRAVEIGCVKMESFLSKDLDELEEIDFTGFEYVSFHAPKFNYGDPGTKYILNRIKRLQGKIGRPFDLVVVHPDSIRNTQIFINSELKIGLENMDSRKSSYRTVVELEFILEVCPGTSFVFDVNHAFSNDPTMRLAKDFITVLGSHISQVHLSGYAGSHEPLFETKQVELIKTIQNLNVPVIVESVLTLQNISKEYDYILQHLCGPK